jgi:hypothetical protein
MCGARHTRQQGCALAIQPLLGLSRTPAAEKGLHQELGRTGRWKDYPQDEPLPVVKGTVIQVTVERLPDGRKPLKDLWLWHYGPVQADADLAGLLWKACLRRFDQEHFHRFAKVYLGLGAAHLASARATDRWTALVMAAFTDRPLWRTPCPLSHPVEAFRTD